MKTFYIFCGLIRLGDLVNHLSWFLIDLYILIDLSDLINLDDLIDVRDLIDLNDLIGLNDLSDLSDLIDFHDLIVSEEGEIARGNVWNLGKLLLLCLSNVKNDEVLAKLFVHHCTIE